MKEKIVYVLVRLRLTANTEISDEQKDEVIQEMDYNFISPLKDITIADTEISEQYDEHPDNKFLK